MKVTYELQLSLTESFLSRRGRVSQVTLWITRVFRNCRNHKFLTSDIYPLFYAKTCNSACLLQKSKRKLGLACRNEARKVRHNLYVVPLERAVSKNGNDRDDCNTDQYISTRSFYVHQ